MGFIVELKIDIFSDGADKSKIIKGLLSDVEKEVNELIECSYIVGYYLKLIKFGTIKTTEICIDREFAEFNLIEYLQEVKELEAKLVGIDYSVIRTKDMLYNSASIYKGGRYTKQIVYRITRLSDGFTFSKYVGSYGAWRNLVRSKGKRVYVS